MATWICPDCRRPFGRVKQGHTCSPGLSLDEYFEAAHERERPIFDVVNDHLQQLGPVDVDPIQIGIKFKNGPVFAELRPMTKWVALTFMLPIELVSSRLSRKVAPAGGTGSRYYHVVNVRDASEIDDTVLDWLTEAYFAVD